jgi:serine phosphatase RsbU (regulator of sigma subunit)
MVRNKSYSSFIQSNVFQYKAGDIMVLYTDGITEAKDGKGDEFGYERLVEIVNTSNGLSPLEIQNHLINKLYEFSGTTNINDDYTTMIVKFK